MELLLELSDRHKMANMRIESATEAFNTIADSLGVDRPQMPDQDYDHFAGQLTGEYQRLSDVFFKHFEIAKKAEQRVYFGRTFALLERLNAARTKIYEYGKRSGKRGHITC